MTKKILIADGPDIERRLGALLKPHESRFVHTLGEAKRALPSDHYALIIIGVHFDESRMFDLLRHVRADERYRATPVVCVVSQPFDTPISVEGLEIATRALAADAFVDFAKYAGREAGDAAIRGVVERLLGDEAPGA
jgi:PleD family two-component response regulator